MTNQSTLHLESGDVSLEIAPPGSLEEHRATRFSPAAYLLQARSGDHTYFFRRGSPMEFDIGERTLPPGFDGCAPGEPFVKIGVGLLERDLPDAYSFSHHYPVRTRPETTLSAERSRARFTQRLDPGDIRIGYELAVDVRLEGNAITLDYALENLGSAPFETEQYLHNFCTLDGAPLSPDYTVDVGYDCTVCDSVGNRLEAPATALVRQLDSRTFGFDPSGPEERTKLFFRPIGAAPRQRWSIANEATGTAMTVEADQPPLVSALYVTGDQISLEMNVAVTVEPGAAARWTRRYDLE
ncbi:MAG: hypothetical protein ACOC7V_06255 [Spirochaetota bacterium]